jgi:hypothetical protein
MARGDVLNVRDLYVGRVSGADYGYRRNLKVSIDLQIGTARGLHTGTEHTETGLYGQRGHKLLTDPLTFSMSASVWNTRLTDCVQCGQCCEVLDDLVSFAPGFDAEKAGRLVNLWQAWHLNNMSAGCSEQAPLYRDGRYGREVDLSATPRCSQTGYRYGRSWLTRELPSGFADEVRSLLPAGLADIHGEDACH